MIYRGHIHNGVVVFDNSEIPPEGAEVEVTLRAAAAEEDADDEIPTLYERMKPFIGITDDLPSDMALNHDHYLYGTPKRE